VTGFLDTNILLYSISRDPSEAEKRGQIIDNLQIIDPFR
jgi:predicted nucleic acid-binding protein